MKDNMFEQLDFGAFKDRIVTVPLYATIEKLAFQCSNVMGTTFNNASPFLDAESPELRLNFVHESMLLMVLR